MSKVIRVYRYGLLPPTENRKLVEEQMRLAHVYRNKLVELERGRRAEVRRINSTVGDIPVLEESYRVADEAFNAALKTVLRARAKARSRAAETPEMKQALAVAREVRSVARRALFDARKKLREDESVRVWSSAAYERFNEAKKKARSECGVYWGTYLLVEDASDMSFDETPLYNGVEPSDPRFSRMGAVPRKRIGVQIQGGMTVEEMFSQTDTRLRVAPVAEAAWLDRTSGEARPKLLGKRPKMRTTLRIRVGTVEGGRDPIWAAWPMVMHRPIPEGAVIKRVDVAAERVGPRLDWYACFTVDETACENHARCGEGRVAVGFGWRAMPEGNIRVMVYADEKGKVIGHELDSKWVVYARKAEELRSQRDKSFDIARDALVTWAKDRELPDFLVEARKTLPMWKSPGRLAALAKRWRLARFTGDDEAYLELETWRYRDHHLWEWESAQRQNAQRQRREKYRILARSLSEQYGEVVLADFDRTKVAKKKDVYENETARSNRQLASTSELEGAIVNAFRRARAKVTKVSAAGMTHKCNACGHANEFDASAQLVATCLGCGTTWDQDENLAKNLLGAHEQPSDEKESGGAREQESGGKWAKKKAEKISKNEPRASTSAAE